MTNRALGLLVALAAFRGAAALPCKPDNDANLLFRKTHVEKDLDFFSASWLMSANHFKALRTENMNIVEDGVWRPMQQYSDEFAMTRDWLDFSLEHLSRYWKMLRVDRGDRYKTLFFALIARLKRYATQTPVLAGAPFRDCICIMPFMPYGQGREGELLTAMSLAATLKSLQRVGVGRVVVVSTVADASKYHKSSYGATEVAFVTVPLEETRTKFIDSNMPYAAIAGLQRAFQQADARWLGRRADWKFVYLTEPDCILHVRASAIPAILFKVNAGKVLAPHRLQPIPHASDFTPPYAVPVLPNTQALAVQDVGPDDGCYDAGNWKPDLPPGCSRNFWYMCIDGGNYTIYAQTRLMRLRHGSGLTLAQADEHGRMCRASCEPGDYNAKGAQDAYTTPGGTRVVPGRQATARVMPPLTRARVFVSHTERAAH
eukprot:CAMPEP_0119264586 /NCGR_PEP_ID=MMETSP1329-20130426/3629_1 /TAXON_ID=114041 /ORGANISM="Genus nov. species nov., Strain RCC1024" /LENGTH=429 /DNA_ID=CAMNT_0007264365 /DNA_START=98 /DNA_END=1384 /DNA_ORIENTATION=+